MEHNRNNRRARDLYDYLATEADRTARAISVFAFEFCKDAHKARNEAIRELRQHQWLERLRQTPTNKTPSLVGANTSSGAEAN